MTFSSVDFLNRELLAELRLRRQAFRGAALIFLRFIENDFARARIKQLAGLAAEDLVGDYDWSLHFTRNFEREFLLGFARVVAPPALVLEKKIPAAVFDCQFQPVTARRISLKLDDGPRRFTWRVSGAVEGQRPDRRHVRCGQLIEINLAARQRLAGFGGKCVTKLTLPQGLWQLEFEIGATINTDRLTALEIFRAKCEVGFFDRNC